MNDQYEGQGGSYIIDEDGARKLVSRTAEAHSPEAEPPVPIEVAAPIEPADAGFFTPVAPAKSKTTTE